MCYVYMIFSHAPSLAYDTVVGLQYLPILHALCSTGTELELTLLATGVVTAVLLYSALLVLNWKSPTGYWCTTKYILCCTLPLLVLNWDLVVLIPNIEVLILSKSFRNHVITLYICLNNLEHRLFITRDHT